jgi:hypothetical protein
MIGKTVFVVPYISSTLDSKWLFSSIPQIQICNSTRPLDILEANVPTVIHIEFEAGLETINLSLHVQYFCMQCLVLILGTHHCTLPQYFCPAAKI